MYYAERPVTETADDDPAQQEYVPLVDLRLSLVKNE